MFVTCITYFLKFISSGGEWEVKSEKMLQEKKVVQIKSLKLAFLFFFFFLQICSTLSSLGGKCLVS